MYTLVETCKLCDVDPKAWLADVLAGIPDHPMSRIDDLLPWHWKATGTATPSSIISGQYPAVLAGCVPQSGAKSAHFGSAV